MRRALRALSWAVAALAVSTIEVAAQRPHARVSVGTLLTRDRGWNYHESFEFAGVVGRTIGFFDLEVGASLIKSFAGEMSAPTASLSPPAGGFSETAFRDGYGGRLHVRLPSASKSSFSALAGVELISDRTDDHVPESAAGGTVGAAWSMGPGNRVLLDLRYVALSNRLGSSRGLLALNLGWRF